MRLGLPFDRPLLRIANAINLSQSSGKARNSSKQKGIYILFHLYN